MDFGNENHQEEKFTVEKWFLQFEP